MIVAICSLEQLFRTAVLKPHHLHQRAEVGEREAGERHRIIIDGIHCLQDLLPLTFTSQK